MRPCLHPGCPALVRTGRCDLHRRRPARTPVTSYGHRWRQARLDFLAEHPFCAHCQQQGRMILATDVDHVHPHQGDVNLFWDESNWSALCHGCHAVKTRGGR